MDPVKRLAHDLEVGGDETYPACAERLFNLGYRMPDCAERWQMDQLAGALFGAARDNAGLEEIARRMIENAGVSR